MDMSLSKLWSRCWTGTPVRCSPWGRKGSGTTQQLSNSNKLRHTHHPLLQSQTKSIYFVGFFFWSPVCRSIETPVRWPRCFFKLQNFPAEFHNGSMLAVYCWNISRENSFGQGGKIHIKKNYQYMILKESQEEIVYKYLFIYTFPFSPRVFQVLGCQGKKRAFVNLWLIAILPMELRSYSNKRIVSADYFRESNFFQPLRSNLGIT